MLTHLLKNLPEKVNKIYLYTIEEPITPNYTITLEEYLQRNGGKLATRDRKSGSNIRSFDKSDVKAKAKQLLEKANSDGYKVYFIEDYAFDEIQLIDYTQYLSMLERIWNDMPREASEAEDETLTVETHQNFLDRGKLWGNVRGHLWF